MHHHWLQLHHQWDLVYQTCIMARYPLEELIRFVAGNFHHHAGQARQSVHFLDLGCGSGANAWFLAREGFKVSGLDCSPKAIEHAQAKLSLDNLQADFNVGLFEALPYPDEHFNCVVDSGGITSTPLSTVRAALREVSRVLKPEGQYFAYFIGNETSVEETPSPEDPHFYNGSPGGPLGRAASVRLFDREELAQELQAVGQFADIQINYALRTANNSQDKVQYWYVQAKKI